MPEFINLSGTGYSKIEVPYKDIVDYPLTFKDSNGNLIQLTGNEFRLEVYRSNPAAIIYTVDGTLTESDYKVVFPIELELGIGRYRFRVVRINDGKTMTRVRGPLKIS